MRGSAITRSCIYWAQANVVSCVSCTAGEVLAAVWSANAGVMARGINWQRFTQQQLLEICECVGGLGLAAVLRLMAEDHAGAAGEAGRMQEMKQLGGFNPLAPAAWTCRRLHDVVS